MKILIATATAGGGRLLAAAITRAHDRSMTQSVPGLKD
jgi:hypothetical protein